MAKDGDLDYGARLSDEEYDRAIIALHSAMPAVLSRKQRREVRRRELELAVDHRLGRDFPRSRRDALWEVQQQVERRRLLLMFKYLLRRLVARGLVRDAQQLAGYLVESYANVLSEAELERFFGKDAAHHPALPVEPEQLKK